MKTDVRAVNTRTMRSLLKTARSCDFNRYPVEDVDDRLTEDAFHVLQAILLYHQRSGASKKPIWPDHHRCRVIAMVDGNPAEFFLDVRVQDWDKLPKAADVMDKIIAANVKGA